MLNLKLWISLNKNICRENIIDLFHSVSKQILSWNKESNRKCITFLIVFLFFKVQWNKNTNELSNVFLRFSCFQNDQTSHFKNQHILGEGAVLSRVKRLLRERKLQPCLAKHICNPKKLHQQHRFFPRMHKSKDLGL